MSINVYFYAAYLTAKREGVHGLIPAVCASSARETLRKELPGTKYLNVHRVPELCAVYDPSKERYRINERRMKK